MKEPSRRVVPWEETRRLGGPRDAWGEGGGAERSGEGEPGLMRRPLRATGQPTGRQDAATTTELACLFEALGQLSPRDVRVQLVHGSFSSSDWLVLCVVSTHRPRRRRGERRSTDDVRRRRRSCGDDRGAACGERRLLR